MRKVIRYMVAFLATGFFVTQLWAKPGVVTDLKGKTYGGDITQDGHFVYINTATGQIKLDRQNVAKIQFISDTTEKPDPATQPNAVPYQNTDNSPEQIFKSRGLSRLGFVLIVPEEQALHDAAVILHAAKSKVVAAVANIRQADDQLKTMNRDLEAMRDRDHEISERVAKGDKSNQLVAEHNLLLDDIASLTDKIAAAEEARSNLLASRSDYITAALDAQQKADPASHAYNGLRTDKQLAAAIDKFNLTARPKVKLGPSGSFDDDLAFVAACNTEVTADTIPITLEGGVPNVEVLLNGQLAQRMIWDSGAAEITLSRKTAHQLGLRPTDKDPVIDLVIASGAHIKEHLMWLDSIRIGACTVEHVQCIVPPDDIEGADLLGDEFQKHFHFKLDVNNQTLQFTPLDAAAVQKKKTVIGSNGKPVIDLLNGISLKDQTVQGIWHQSDGALCSDQGIRTRIDFNYAPPAEYDYRVTFTKLEGNDSIDLILCARGRQFAWLMGSGGNKHCGFDQINARGAGDNASTVKNFPLLTGKTYDCVVKVRAHEVSAYVEGRLLSQYETDYCDMGTRAISLYHTDTLGIATYATSYAISNAQVTEIAGSGTAVNRATPSKAKLLATLNYHVANENRTVSLFDNGHFLARGDDNHRWYWHGDSLIFRWLDRVDICTLSADHRTFSGHGSHGEPLTGEFLSGSLTGEKSVSDLAGPYRATPPGGLVLFLPFSEADTAGVIHDQSLSHLEFPGHGVTYQTDPASKTRRFAEFDSTAWIDGKKFGALPATRGFTLSAWFKGPLQKQGPMIEQRDWKNDRHNGAAIGLEDSVPEFVIGTDHWLGLKGPTQIISDKWYHLAGTFDGSVARLYINGLEEGSERSHSPFNPSTFPLEIGKSPFDDKRIFNGTLADIMIFNRALSADEIGSLAGLKK
jgi:hypothetical protein